MPEGNAAEFPRRVSILIPVYNERATLAKCVHRVLAAPLPEGLDREVIVVDDASTDGSDEIIRDLAGRHPGVIRAFRQEYNQGKGAAIRRAIAEMRGQYAIFQDADLEYDPNEYPVLLRPFFENNADVVYGSRFASSARRRVLNYHHALGNKFLTHCSNLLTGLNLTDMETCYKAFRADVLKTVPLRSNRFGIEPEITAKIAKRGYIVYEVPISYHGRKFNEGKKIGWKDGFSAIYTILKYWIVDDCYEDRYGHDILANLARARRFNSWTVQLMEPYLGRRILEIGSGIGNISRLLPRKELLTVSDVDAIYLELLENAFRDNDTIEVEKLDLNQDADFERLTAKEYDTVVCLNVLEHIESDAEALGRMRRLLSPGGKLVLLVPQHPALFGSYDKALGHHRRYRFEDLKGRLEAAGFRIRARKNFNFLSILGWWFYSCLLRRATMSKYHIKFFDMLVPILRPIESLLPLPGLSLLVVAEVPEPDAAPSR